MSDTPTIVRLADDAYQAIRALNHHTIRGAIPAPVIYEVLGSLKLLGPALEQAIRQLGDGLEDSLTEYDVYEDDGADPSATVTRCRAYLCGAASSASHLGAAIEAAQASITRQSYRTSDY